MVGGPRGTLLRAKIALIIVYLVDQRTLNRLDGCAAFDPALYFRRVPPVQLAVADCCVPIIELSPGSPLACSLIYSGSIASQSQTIASALAD